MYEVGNFTSNSTYKANLDHVHSSIATAKDTGNSFYNFSYGQSSESANTIAEDMRSLILSCFIFNLNVLSNLHNCFNLSMFFPIMI